MSSAVFSTIDQVLADIPAARPILIAGPTASGKSALAIRIAQTAGGVIVNADALQVFDCWQVLSARPDAVELAQASHALYGHVDYRTPYSTGHWLRDVAPYLDGSVRPIIVGGTGLNFTALTEGLADIPPIPAEVRAQASDMSPAQLFDDLQVRDPTTFARIDTRNPARLQRAWEVLQATGKSLAAWQDDTPAPLLPLSEAFGLVVDAPKDWLSPRISQRFEKMLANGALDEVAAVAQDWDPILPSAKAIGAPELMAHLRGEMSLEDAITAATIATRQYAKRQRTWFNARMKSWARIDAAGL